MEEPIYRCVHKYEYVAVVVFRAAAQDAVIGLDLFSATWWAMSVVRQTHTYTHMYVWYVRCNRYAVIDCLIAEK